jgi:dTDP-4-amino-4,6-dideoxygalactose transaminase
VKYHNELAGVNSRLGELQAALLRVKLRHLPELIAERKAIAKEYLEGIKNPKLTLPKTREGAEHVYHQFVVRAKDRDGLQKYLENNGIQTVIHYPIPPHLAECYQKLGYKEGDYPIAEKYAKEVLSLPMFNGMREEEVKYVVDVLNDY